MAKGFVIVAITADGMGGVIMTVINPRVLNWFTKRGIDEEIVVRTGICSGTRLDTGEVIPDANGEIIIFPFIRDGHTVGEKYRAAGKRFWQKAGGVKTFMNADVLSDPALKRGDTNLVIVEGEPDLLTALQCGFHHTVSVPDGAPPEVQGNIPDDDLPDTDQKFSYVAADWDRLKLIKRITIAVDNDGPGKRLAEELVRRLGRVRCYWVEYPDDCKDINDVLLKHGPERVASVLNGAKPYPVHGLYTLSEFPPEPPLNPLSTGWGRLDDHLRVFYPGIMAVTGFANAGKSTWTNQLVANLAMQHGWPAAIASFEMRLDPYVTDTLRAVFLGKPRRAWTPDDIQRANDWINEYFLFISPTDDDDQKDLDWLIERAEAAVIRHGIRVLMIDPWNEIEHSIGRNEQRTDYTGRALQALKRFGRTFDCFVIVVGHPTKEGARKKDDAVSLYDMADSAHFANKVDLGVVVCRVAGAENQSKILIRKVRYQPDTGKLGEVEFSYDPDLRLFAQ